MKKCISVVLAVAFGVLMTGAIYQSVVSGLLGRIVIDSPPMGNTYVGVVRKVIPATDMLYGDLVYVSTSIGLGYPYVRKADADAAATVGDIMVMVEAANSGGVALALDNGMISCSRWDFDSAGLALYVSTTSGLIVPTAPSGSGDQVQRVGYSESSGVIKFRPSLDVTTVE